MIFEEMRYVNRVINPRMISIHTNLSGCQHNS